MGMAQSEAADGARRIMEVAMIGVERLPEEGTGPKNERPGHSRNTVVCVHTRQRAQDYSAWGQRGMARGCASS